MNVTNIIIFLNKYFFRVLFPCKNQGVTVSPLNVDPVVATVLPLCNSGSGFLLYFGSEQAWIWVRQA
jgi:hypothetical protein